MKFFAEFDETKKSVRDLTKKKGNLREQQCGSKKKREKRFSCLGLERLRFFCPVSKSPASFMAKIVEFDKG